MRFNHFLPSIRQYVLRKVVFSFFTIYNLDLGNRTSTSNTFLFVFRIFIRRLSLLPINLLINTNKLDIELFDRASVIN